MPTRTGWKREELLVAFALYCRIPFGKFHRTNPELIHYAKRIGRTPSALAMKLCNIASIDPAFTSSGRRGLEGASAADREMWSEMQADWQSFALKSEAALNDLGYSNDSAVIEQEEYDSQDFSSEDKEGIVKTRVGQSFFRKAVLSAYENKCCISGLAMPKLLVASHIVPWRSDVKNRLNPANGLALSMLHDEVFDLGIITINEDLTVRVTKKLPAKNDKFFSSAIANYDGCHITLPEKFQPNSDFLRFHRENVFEKWLKKQ